ncbi:MAG: hypothetical protein PHV20_09995 [Bacteroidales bacterium]|nr:hypothetical protein [Bacteroidales bacterium]
MNPDPTQRNTYHLIRQESENKQVAIQRKLNYIAFYRLLTFAIFAFLIWVSIHSTLWIPITEGILGIIGFAVLVKRNNKLLFEKEYYENKIRLFNKELQLIDYNFEGLDDAEEAIDYEHAFANDLDLFGRNSLFQYLNRGMAGLGREKLIRWMNTPLTEEKEIEQRQIAVQELADKADFRVHFSTTGLMFKGSAELRAELQHFFESVNVLLHKKGIRIAVKVMPILTIAALAMAVANLLPYALFSLAFILNLGLVGTETKKVNRIHAILGDKLAIFKSYESLFAQIEVEKFTSPQLQNMQVILTSYSNNPTRLLKQLTQQADRLNQRANLVVAVLLNGLFLWDLRVVIAIERLKTQAAELLPDWFEALAEFDALCSLATFRYNHPNYIFPEIDNNSDSLKIQQMGHPLIHREKCVKNHLTISSSPYFIIVTGANMAGKSTYLRTVGTNYLLACIGAPVCASEMTFRPAHLATSLRTTDSLAKNESYFFAELKRLQTLIQRLEKGERLFIILDEILKGTNSTDKQKGSLALVARLLKFGGTGIIATHDLLLGTLADTFPDQVSNFRFEAEIQDDTLSFTYKIQSGIAQNMNACFLMKKMGIINPN